MNAKIIPIITLFSAGVFLFSSCEDSTYKEYTGNAPVYLSYDDLRSAVKEEQNIPLENPGKIYFKDNYIFIVEEMKGIHVFDNTDPASPVKKSFIAIPGVVDMSVSGYIMYADSYVDLVVLDVQNVDNIHEVGRVEDIFPYTVPPTGNDYPMAGIDDDRGVVVSWEVKKIREKVYDPYYYPYPIYWERGDFFAKVNSGGASSGVSGSGIGVGGSMARFGIKENVLYIVDNNTLKVFDITNKTAPSKLRDIYPGWGIETMFLTDKNMFLGTTTGMVIYDITLPSAPSWKSFYNHLRSCDPVVVDNNLAYVTLRSGTNCGGNINVLDVVDITNLSSPALLATFPMTNPHGLGKDGNLLFICDGSAGLKIYDASDPLTISSHLLFTYSNISAYDVIPIGDVLVMIGENGLYQYDYSNIASISLLSQIQVVKPD